MIRLALAIGFLSVFGFIAWALAVRITKENNKPETKDETKQKEKTNEQAPN